MKNLLLLITLVSVICLSCDGRQTKKESLERAVATYNFKNTPLKVATYHPESYVEIITDTLISNSVKVRVKNFSLLDQQILVSETTDESSENLKYQRVFESEIKISTATKDILNAHISAKQFKATIDDPFWNTATLQHVWVNQELSNAKTIKLDMTFINPKNEAYKLYRMSVDINGQQTLYLIEERG